jgi:hypothetical protein
MSKDLLPLAEAVEKVTGYRPNIVTAWRWSTKGCQGVRLQNTFIGAKRLTTVEWVKQFMDELAVAKLAKHTVVPPMQTPRQQERNAEKAAKKLAKRLKPGAAK